PLGEPRGVDGLDHVVVVDVDLGLGERHGSRSFAYRYPPVGLVSPPPRSFFRQFCIAAPATSTVMIGPVVRPIAIASRTCLYPSRLSGFVMLVPNGCCRNAWMSVGPAQPIFCSA